MKHHLRRFIQSTARSNEQRVLRPEPLKFAEHNTLTSHLIVILGVLRKLQLQAAVGVDRWAHRNGLQAESIVDPVRPTDAGPQCPNPKTLWHSNLGDQRSMCIPGHRLRRARLNSIADRTARRNLRGAEGHYDKRPEQIHGREQDVQHREAYPPRTRLPREICRLEVRHPHCAALRPTSPLGDASSCATQQLYLGPFLHRLPLAQNFLYASRNCTMGWCFDIWNLMSSSRAIMSRSC